MIAITDFASLIVAAVILCFSLAICFVTILFVLAMSRKDETSHGQNNGISIYLKVDQAAPIVHISTINAPRQHYLPAPQTQLYLPAAHEQNYLPSGQGQTWRAGQPIILNEQGKVIDREW